MSYPLVRLSSTGRRVRDAQIVQRAREGWTPAQLSRVHALSVRRISQILKAGTKAPARAK